MNKKKLAEGIFKVVTDTHNESRPDIIMETKVFVKSQPKRIPMPSNTMVFQAAAYLCATKLPASTNRILMYFLSSSEYENFIGVDIKTLEEELQINERTVLRGLKELEANNIIIKIKNGRDRRRHDYFINPSMAWKGNSATWDRTKKKLQIDNPNQLDLFGDKKPNIRLESNYSKEPSSEFDDFKEVNDGKEV